MGGGSPKLAPRTPPAPTRSPFYLMGRDDAKKRKKAKSLKNQTIFNGKAGLAVPEAGTSLLGSGSPGANAGGKSPPKNLLGQ